MRDVLQCYEDLHNMLTNTNQEEELCRAIMAAVQEIVDELPTHANIALRPKGEFTAFFCAWLSSGKRMWLEYLIKLLPGRFRNQFPVIQLTKWNNCLSMLC